MKSFYIANPNNAAQINAFIASGWSLKSMLDHGIVRHAVGSDWVLCKTENVVVLENGELRSVTEDDRNEHKAAIAESRDNQEKNKSDIARISRQIRQDIIDNRIIAYGQIQSLTEAIVGHNMIINAKA